MWKVIYGYNVFIENGLIIRAMKGNGTLPASVYKKSRHGGWDNACPCTVSAFRSGVYRGTYAVF